MATVKLEPIVPPAIADGEGAAAAENCADNSVHHSPTSPRHQQLEPLAVTPTSPIGINDEYDKALKGDAHSAPPKLDPIKSEKARKPSSHMHVDEKVLQLTGDAHAQEKDTKIAQK